MNKASYRIGRTLALSALMVSALARPSGAQPASTAPPPSGSAQAADPQAASAQAADAQTEAQARAHFTLGNEYFRRREFLEAYNEFMKSLALKRVRAVMGGAASSLMQLGRYDEALDLYEALRREFPTLSAKLEAKVTEDMKALEGLVGTLVLTGDTPDGATVFIDDRVRGKLPLRGPLRVGVGTHAIRVEKEGFPPIVSSVDTKPREQSAVSLVAKSRQGRLIVRERRNLRVQVYLDRVSVGDAPWEGLVNPGEHSIEVRGYVGVDLLDECAVTVPSVGATTNQSSLAYMGSIKAEKAAISLYETTSVTVAAQELDTVLRVDSKPTGADVLIDWTTKGKTPWVGRLPLGKHDIVVSADGFVTSTQRVELERRSVRSVDVVLERVQIARAREFWTGKTAGAAVAYGAAVLGLGTWAVAGGLAVHKQIALEDECTNGSCFASARSDLVEGSAFAGVATVGIVVAGLGAATGTGFLIFLRSSDAAKEPKPAAPEPRPTLDAAVGLGALELKGTF